MNRIESEWAWYSDRVIRLKKLVLGVIVFLVVVIVMEGVWLAIWGQKTSNKELSKFIDQSYKSELQSPDGKMVLTMRREGQKNQPQTYTFKVGERLIFARILESSGEMAIPHNSWSPDNKYVFVQEKDESGQVIFLVLKTSGEAFKNGDQYLNVSALFDQKMKGLLLRDATGWASPTLVNIETSKDETKKGPSYWFDVDSRSFLQHR